MITHKIFLGRQTGRALATPCSLEPNGPELLRSCGPIYAAARYLLDNGIAQPEDRIETWRGSTLSMFGQIGRCAKVRVYETSIGIRLGLYRPFKGPPTEPEVDDLLQPLTKLIAEAPVDH